MESNIYSISKLKITMVIIFAIIASLMIVPAMINGLTKNDLTVVIIFAFVTVFVFYIWYMLFAILSQKYSNISIDDNMFVLEAKNKEMYGIDFEDVKRVNIIKGEMIRGISFGHVRIVTIDNQLFELTISNPDNFYVEICKHLEVSIDERIFFNVR